MDVNTPLGGEQPVSAIPVLLFNSRLTAVAATSTGDFTVVFIGTATGHLKKVSESNLFLYELIRTIDKSGVLHVTRTKLYK